MSHLRMESDFMGGIEVAKDRYWGAQTQRAIENFPIGGDRIRWGRSLIRSLGILKKAAALANKSLGELPEDLTMLIVRASDAVISGTLDAHFPLVVFQTGSGAQANMNANEVISNRAIELTGGIMGSKKPVHPDDHVNRCQAGDDAFSTVMHIAVVSDIHERLLPALAELHKVLTEKSNEYASLVKTGRTHLRDASPITLGQEIGAWAAQLRFGTDAVTAALPSLYELAVGGTAVGTGLHAHPRFGGAAAAYISEITGYPFKSAENKFFALAAHDALVHVSAALRTLAGGLMKMANDVRWLASGPYCGIGELRIPENDPPGSSIMPGKVNPTQCEALVMVAVQVFGNDAAVAFAGSQGDFQLNVYQPVMGHNVLESIELLSDAVRAFTTHCAAGIAPDNEVIEEKLNKNLTLVTALSPHIGYDKAARIAGKAWHEAMTLQEAALALGYCSAEEFKRWVAPLAMTMPTEQHS